jgi:hypothetical protein
MPPPAVDPPPVPTPTRSDPTSTRLIKVGFALLAAGLVALFVYSANVPALFEGLTQSRPRVGGLMRSVSWAIHGDGPTRWAWLRHTEMALLTGGLVMALVVLARLTLEVRVALRARAHATPARNPG